MIETLMRFYYRRIRAELSNLSDSQIRVDGLGEFTLKHWLLDEEIEKQTQIVNKFKSRNKPNEEMIKSVQDKIDLLLKAKNIHNEDQQRKDFVKLHKRAQYEQNKNNLEKPETDMGGVL